MRTSQRYSPRSLVAPAVALVVMATALAACRGTAPLNLTVPLSYRATSKVDATKFGGALPANAKVFVATVTDKRRDTSSIGANKEKPKEIPILAAGTGMKPGDFVREGLMKELANVGISVAATQAASTHVLYVQLDRFWAEEASTYHGDLVARLRLTDKGGATRFEGVIKGTSSRWGKSLSPDNYIETWSDAVVSLTENLLADAAFQKALKGN